MYCKKCGGENKEGVKFCKHCGIELPGNIVSKQIEEIYQEDNLLDEDLDTSANSNDTAEEIVKKHKIFYNKDEKLIGTLGSGFLSSLFVQTSASKSVLFCSDKRVYQRGKLIERDYQGKIMYYNGQRSVNIIDITGLSYLIADPIHMLRFPIMFVLLGIFGIFVASNMSGDIVEYLGMVSGGLIGIAIMLTILYAFKHGKFFVIEHAGGRLITNCNWYKKKSIIKFMKTISVQKDILLDK